MFAALLAAAVRALPERRAQLSFLDGAGRGVELSLPYFLRAERAMDGVRLGVRVLALETRDCEPLLDASAGEFFAAFARAPEECEPARLVARLIARGAQLVFVEVARARRGAELAADVWDAPLFLLEPRADPFALAGLSPPRRFVTAAFAMPAGPADRARLTLVYDPAHEYSRRFLEAAERVHARLGDRLAFEPRAFTFPSQAEEYVRQHCVAQGAYCAVPPAAPGASGRSVVLEALRQKCVFADGARAFFAYAREFYAHCARELSEDCARRCAEAVGADFAAVQRCVAGSFSKVAAEPLENDNRLLAEDREAVRRLGVESFPELLVNDVRYRGSLSAADLLFAVCSALGAADAACRPPPAAPASRAVLLVSLCAFALGSAALWVLCRRLARRRHLLRLDKAVDRYLGDYGRAPSLRA